MSKTLLLQRMVQQFIFIAFCLSSQNQQEWGQVKNAQDPRDPNLFQVRWPLQASLQVQAVQDEAGRRHGGLQDPRVRHSTPPGQPVGGLAQQPQEPQDQPGVTPAASSTSKPAK